MSHSSKIPMGNAYLNDSVRSRTRTQPLDPFSADRMGSPNPLYRLAFSRMKMESPSGRPQIESTRLLEMRLVAMGKTLHSP